jgi:cytochrome P450
MYMASVDTVSLSEYWTHVLADHLQTVSAVLTFIVAMILYPDVQRKAQAEIDQIVGNSRLPDFSDEAVLPYVQAVLKEVLRWHPVTPLGLSISVVGSL